MCSSDLRARLGDPLGLGRLGQFPLCPPPLTAQTTAPSSLSSVDMIFWNAHVGVQVGGARVPDQVLSEEANRVFILAWRENSVF